MRRIELNKFKLIFIVSSLVLNLLLSIYFLNKNVNEIGYEIGEDVCVNSIGLIINETINNSNINEENILIFDYNDSKLVSISFDNETINRYEELVNKEIIQYLKSRKTIYHVPLLSSSTNILFRQLSPNVPIVYTLVGNVVVDSDSLVQSYGINNALIEVNMNISMSIRVLLPFKTEKFLVNKEVTLVSKLIHGDIPSYYLGTNSINSTIPIR